MTDLGRHVVTIDGPAGAGKSTVARELSKRLGWRLLDTGAMYRAVALAALERGVPLDSDKALANLTGAVHVELPPDEVWLDGDEISGRIRTPEVSRAASRVAACPSVRARLVAWQRAFAAAYPTVAEGRDQGTVVFPDALCKFYLTATSEERARRRHDELRDRGESVELPVVLRDQNDRDRRDSDRAVGPLCPASDAIEIDTTGRGIAELVDQLENIVREHERDATDRSANRSSATLWRKPGVE